MKENVPNLPSKWTLPANIFFYKGKGYSGEKKVQAKKDYREKRCIKNVY